MRVCPKCGMQHSSRVAYCTRDGTLLTELDQPLTESGLDGPRPGTVLGAYRLERLLGIGGMGFVYLAEHTRLGRRVALKMLRQEYTKNADLVRRFFGEARAVNQIAHENIVQITDFIEAPGGDNYYIMELLEGDNLGHLLSDRGPLPIERVLRIAHQAADALAAVHAAGIIHRDLKSENIFLITAGGQPDFVKLLDFGLAKLIEDNKATHQTAEGVILGTPEYMSPEQAEGKAVDHRADIYSLGIILYEMLTGRKPFIGQEFGQVAVQHITRKPTRPSKLKNPAVRVPRRLERLVLDMLAKDPAARPQTMREVHQRLSEIAGSESVLLKGELPPRGARRAARWSALAAGLLLLGAAGIGLAHWQGWLAAPAADRRPAADPTPRNGAADTSGEPEPQPVEVTIALESRPAGARVRRLPDGAVLGETPLSLSFAKSDAFEQLELALSGHLPVIQRVPLAADRRLLVLLPRRPRSGAGPERRPGRAAGQRPAPTPPDSGGSESAPLDPDGTVNPFGG
jgi:serine/threonine-protein kinase